LPVGVAPPSVSNFVPEELDERPLLEYTVSGPYTPGTLTTILDEEIRPRLATVEGVSGVESFGIAETGVSVIYEPARLRQLGVLPDALAMAVRDARQVQSLGIDQRGASELPVVLRDQPKVIQDCVLVRGPGDLPAGELAEVRQEEDTRGRFHWFRRAVRCR
jgi:multidrug efflux pump subunit AcrB